MPPLFPRPKHPGDPGSQETQTLWTEWLERIQTDGINLTAWEEEFIESVGDQVAAGRTLSRGQGEIIERIYTARVP